MKSFLIVAAAGAALAFIAPMTINRADAQTVVIKRNGPPHGHMHHPRRKKVIVIDRGRHHGWSRHQHRHGQGHRNHGHGGTVGISVR
jgi:hypothetical protein